MPWNELFVLAERMECIGDAFDGSPEDDEVKNLAAAIEEVEKSWSGSWLGYHSRVYYSGLKSPPSGARFSSEWGMDNTIGMGTRGDWNECDPDKIRAHIIESAGSPDLQALVRKNAAYGDEFEEVKAEVLSILQTANPAGADNFLAAQAAAAEELELHTTSDILNYWKPAGQVMTRDMIAMGQGFKSPPHLKLRAEIAVVTNCIGCCTSLAKIARKAGSHIERTRSQQVAQARVGTNVFIGHGRAHAWRDLKDFLQDRLLLPWDEFNRVPVAGVTNQGRLIEMLDSAAVAFVIMTAEDENADGGLQARMNVIHEVGLFQGRLGFTKAIVLLEEGCDEFSNIQGLGQIRFPAGNISACFEDIRQVLEREGVLETG